MLKGGYRLETKNSPKQGVFLENKTLKKWIFRGRIRISKKFSKKLAYNTKI